MNKTFVRFAVCALLALSATAFGQSRNVSGTVTVGGTSQQVMPGNSARTDFYIENPATETENLCVNIGVAGSTTASCTAAGNWIIAPGGALRITSRDAVYAVAATTGHKFNAREQSGASLINPGGSSGAGTVVTNAGTFAVQNTTATPAGAAIIGQVGIDQTTNGTTNKVSAVQNGTWTVQPGNTANTTAWKVDGSAVTQPAQLVAGTAIAGKFGIDQTTPGTTDSVTAKQGGTWTVQPGNTANTTAWKVDGSAVTQPVNQVGGAAVAPKVGDATGAITDTFDAIGILRRDALTSLSSATAKWLPLQGSKWGAVFVEGYEKHSRTYSSTVNVASASSATDIAYIAGSATSPALVTRVIISGIQTAASSVDFTLLTRSTANSAGTCTAATMVAHDPGDSAANAVVTSCTANPTTGTLVGAVRRAYQLVPAASGTSSVPPLVFDFGKEGKPITLTTSNKVLAVNLGGVTVTGGTFSITFEWIENP